MPDGTRAAGTTALDAALVGAAVGAACGAAGAAVPTTALGAAVVGAACGALVGPPAAVVGFAAGVSVAVLPPPQAARMAAAALAPASPRNARRFRTRSCACIDALPSRCDAPAPTAPCYMSPGP